MVCCYFLLPFIAPLVLSLSRYLSLLHVSSGVQDPLVGEILFFRLSKWFPLLFSLWLFTSHFCHLFGELYNFHLTYFHVPDSRRLNNAVYFCM